MLENKLKELIEVAKEENPAMCGILNAVYAALKTGKERELLNHVAIFTEEQIASIITEQIKQLMQEKAQLN